MTCSGQRQCWEQRGLYFCSSLPVMFSGVLYEQCVPVYPFCFLSWWNWATALQDRTQGMTTRSICSSKDTIQGGGSKHKSTATARKRQWKMGLLYVWLKTFLDKFKNPIKTTKSLPCYTHTFTEQEQCISSQITLWRGISIPWHHSLSWDLRHHPLLLSTWLLTLPNNWSRNAFVTQSLLSTILIHALHLCFADMHPTVPELCSVKALISL